MIAPARKAAFEVVRRVFEEEAYADRALASAVAGLDARDRALAQRLAYGTVQMARTLDFGIEQLGKRPVRKLDPPVRAALRLGAYQLAFTDQADHAVVDDTVELVRAARLERAVPFTNAVMRKLAHGLQGLVASLPEGPLKHSYPDWIAEIWTRDFGREVALELMRAQNEPPGLEVRSAEPVGEPTDVPGAYIVETVDTARMRPMSRASQLAALVVGSQEGERILDLCAAPGGKSMMLAGERDRGRGASGPRAGDGEERRPERARRHRRRPRARRERLRPGARRRAVLRPRRPGAAPRPALARAAAAGAPARAAPGGRRAHEARRDDRLLGVHAERRRERGGRRRLRARAGAARRGVAAVRASDPAGVPADAPAPRPDERVLHRAVEVVGSNAVAWRDWIRTIEVEPSLYGADFAHLGDQIEQLLRAECRIFHFDVGDGHFVEPITMGPIVLASISPLIHRHGGAIDVHLMVENPAKYFEPVAAAGGDSVTFHYEAVDDVAATIRAAREHGLQVGVAFNPESEPEAVAAVSGDADLVLCMAIHPGYSGQQFMEATYDRVRRLRRALGDAVHDPGGRRRRRREHRADPRLRRDAARRRRRRSSGTRTSRAPTARLVRALA